MIIGCALAAMSSQAVLADNPIKNGLSSRAFRRNALTTNQKALRILTRHSLNDPGLFSDEDDYIKHQLQDPGARAMLAEIIKCALPLTTTVNYDNHQWQGELGLCKAKGGPGTWDTTNGPNKECQQLVTACLAARVNALDRSIPISLQGEPSALFPPRNPVSTEKTFRESPPGQDPSGGTPIDSFTYDKRCPSGGECNWAAAHVGTCAPGSSIQLAIRDRAVCAITTSIRVCAGIHGCYAPKSGHVKPVDQEDRDSYLQGQYSKWLKDEAGTCNIIFVCPDAGYYSVMVHHNIASGEGVTFTDRINHPTITIKSIIAIGSRQYPANENSVFPFLEGGFYGNLFSPESLTWNCEIIDYPKKPTISCTNIEPKNTKFASTGGQLIESCPLDEKNYKSCNMTKTLPYKEVYACYNSNIIEHKSATFDYGTDYLNSRICTEPRSDCFFHAPKPCYDPNSSVDSAHCDWSDPVYHRCKDQSGFSYLTITTYLNNPCDIDHYGKYCHTNNSSIPKPAY